VVALAWFSLSGTGLVRENLPKTALGFAGFNWWAGGKLATGPLCHAAA